MALKWTNKAQGALNSSADRKLRISSLTKAIGLASVFGAATALSPAAQALKTDFGIEYRATGFYVQSDAFEAAASDTDEDNGFAHLIRLKTDFLDEDTGISLHTSVEVAGDRWSGDSVRNSPTGGQAFNTTNTGDSVRLDLGYVQIPMGHTVFRVGRQATSYNSCFLVCDDRRDRILMIQPFSKDLQVLAIYDRRQDSDPFLNADNGDQFGLAAVGKMGGVNASLLLLHYLKNDSGVRAPANGGPGPSGTQQYALQANNAVSGYVNGDIGELAKLTVGFNYFMDGELTNEAAPGVPIDGMFFADDSLSQFLRLEGSVGVVDWGVQYAGAQDGGLISGGFDTYSSLINNNPESTNSPTSVYTMGQKFGYKDFDQQLIAGKLTWNLSPKFAITGAVGQLDIDNPGIDALGPLAPSASDTSMFYDLQLSYQVNKSLKTWVTYGILEKNEADTLAGNSLIGGTPPNGGSFADDDVQAASVNLAVSF